MSYPIGNVKRIWQFPVKSMAGEQVMTARFDSLGMIGDRRWCLVNDLTGEIIGGKRLAKIMQLSACFTEKPLQRDDIPSVEINFPDGYQLKSDHADISAVLSAFLGHPVSLRSLSNRDDFFRKKVEASPVSVRYELGLGPNGAISELASFPLKMLDTLGKFVTPPGVLHDVFPLHFVTTATLDWLQLKNPKAHIDGQRFRPNFEIETLPHLEGEVEKDWIEGHLEIGDCMIQVIIPTIRCSQPAQAQPEMKKDPEIGHVIRTSAQQYVGCYAKVVKNGSFNVGDVITYHPAAEYKKAINRTLIQLKKPVIGFALNAAEKAWEKKRLKAPPKSINEQLQNQGFRAFKVERIDQESLDIKSLYLLPEDGSTPSRPLAGQHLVLALASEDKPLIRSYTISGFDPINGYRISVKREKPSSEVPQLEAGLGSTYLHDQLTQNMTVYAKGPSGNYFLHPCDERPIVLISIGVGITPMIAIANEAIIKNPDRSVCFLHGTRNSHTHVFENEIDQLRSQASQFEYRLFFSDPLPEDKPGMDFHSSGRVNVDALKMAADKKDALYFLCGKQDFMEQSREVLLECGVPLSNIKIEYFKKQRTQATGAKSYDVSFERSGIKALWTPESGSLLELAETVGLQPQYGCRYGACEACSALLIDGDITYDQNMPNTQDKSILLCSAIPASNIRLDL